MTIHPKQREKTAVFMFDIAKILFGSFVIGPFLAGKGQSVNLVIVNLGVLCFIIAVISEFVLSRPKEEL
jgi:hypothetical protein